jgi:hypothetical protein
MCARETRLQCKKNGSKRYSGWTGKGPIQKSRYCGHQSTRLCRGQVLGLVGGTDLYYKKEWGPREVHGDSLGTITDCPKVGKGV